MSEIVNGAMQRRYLFKLYPTAEQAAVLDTHRRMIADLWNALLQRHEDIRRRTMQRQRWIDSEGIMHHGDSIHSLTWVSHQLRAGESVLIEPAKNGRPRHPTTYDLQNEITWMLNCLPEWRELSVWCAHRTAASLDRAFKSFYRRAAQGAGAQSGYPRFKRRDDHNSIPHRCASGCKLLKDNRHPRSWRLGLKGVPGHIHARGRMPAQLSKWTDADVLWRDGQWWISIACEIAPRRMPGRRHITIRLNAFDTFATVDGVPHSPDGLAVARRLDEYADELKAVRDGRWPRGHRIPDDDREELMALKRRIAAISAKSARIRRNALHVWTARIIAAASDLTVVAPPVKESTRTPRGNSKVWGAHVEVISQLNRNTLSQAPAMAIEMLRYKAAEAGIRCDVIEDSDPDIAVGADLVQAGKTLRRARRELRRTA